MNIKFTKVLFLLTLVFFIASCSNDDDNGGDDDIGGETKVEKSDFIETYAKIAAANYADAYNTAVDMQTEINAFLLDPSADGLVDAQQAWLYARDYYGQTEAFREADGPIDNSDWLDSEGLINSWPLEESYIDYVSDNAGGYNQTGIIGDEDFDLTELNLNDNNQLNDNESDVLVGWHAIEFLLWGQDLNYDTVNHTTDNYEVSGLRAYTDYTTANFAERRKDYLELVTNMLISNLKDLNDTWAVGGAYRTAFEALDEDVAIKNILNGIGFISNGEVAEERLVPPIDLGQENEHSCFSDNTNQDMWANVNGINNVIVGSYTTESGIEITGTSLIKLVEQEDADVASELTAKASETLTRLDTLLSLGKNFDEIISEESITADEADYGPAGKLYLALVDQGSAISDAATALGVSISID